MGCRKGKARQSSLRDWREDDGRNSPLENTLLVRIWVSFARLSPVFG